ncbi:MAG: chromosomal replication initiator protein DnaA [Pseudomonadota bacterium]
MATPLRRGKSAHNRGGDGQTGDGSAGNGQAVDGPLGDGQAARHVHEPDVRKWARIQAMVRTKLGNDAYVSWFGRCRLEEVDKTTVTLSVPTVFLRNWIRNHYLSMLLTFWQEDTASILRVDVIVRSAVRNPPPSHGNPSDGRGNDDGPLGSGSQPRQGPPGGGRGGVSGRGAGGGAAAQTSRGRAMHPAERTASAQDRSALNGAARGSAGAMAHSTARQGSGVQGSPHLGSPTESSMPQVATKLPRNLVDRMSGRDGLSQDAAAPVSISASGRSGFAGSPLDPGYTFETFVEGAANRMACAAAKSVAESDGAVSRFNPLFIHANVGLGKTHLLQSIAWAAASRNSGMKILYLTAEYFMWRFASALRDKSALSFKESLREIDLLLIDDMQFLQGKSIQQEFCHLLNALIDSAKQVVVAADRPPSELESLNDRVKSRLKGGVALEIKAPDFEMRQTILRVRYEEARREDPSLRINDSILKYVAETVVSSGRDLEGAFNQLLIQQKFTDGEVELESIEKLLGHLVQSSEQRRVRIEDIQRVVGRHYNVPRTDLLSTRRTQVIVRPRQISMYLSKILTPRSLPEIGRRFGGRDHTTVLHAVRKIESLLKDDKQLAQEIELLKRLIHEQGQ